MKEEAKAAAQWWVNVLREMPAKNNGNRFDSEMMTYSATLVYQLAKEDLTTLEPAIEQEILTMLEQSNWPSMEAGDIERRFMECDYDPDERLVVAVAKAGVPISPLLWPIKTIMSVNPGEVTVKCGYGAPFKTIYSATAITTPQADEA